MMKWIFAILLLFICGTTLAQIGQGDDSTKYIRYQYQYGSRMPRYWADSVLHIPYYDTARFKPQKAGAIMMHLDKNVYKWNGGGWEVLGGAPLSLSNVGSGFRWVKTPAGQVKTSFAGYGIIKDSTTNTDGITDRVDTSSTNHIVTQSDLNDAIAGAGSGITGLTAGRVTLSTSASTVGDDGGLTYNSTSNELTTDSAVLKKAKIDSIRVQVTAPKTQKKAYFFGTSITVGYYAQDASAVLDTTRRWSTYTCQSQGWQEVNYGVSGMVMQDRSPGATNFIDDRMSFIPTYDAATDTAIFFEFGINDQTKTDQGLTNYNTTNFVTDYSTGIDAAISKGWPLNIIFIVASNWVDPARNLYNTQTTQDAYYVATKTVATNKSVNLIDVYQYSYVNRGRFLYSDGLHPSNVGHSDYAIKVLDDLNAAVYKDAQTVAANGIVEVQSLKLKGSDTSDIYTQPLGVNKFNNIVKFPNGAFIENAPLVPQQAKINIRGMIDVTGTDGTDGVIRGKMLRATGARAANGIGAGFEAFYYGSTTYIYSLDQVAPAWKPLIMQSSTYAWNAGGNTDHSFNLDASGQFSAVGNGDGGYINYISNSSTGTGAAALLQIGANATPGNGLMLRYNGANYTTSGAYEQATSIIDAGPNISNGLNIIASHASAGIKFFTGGATTGNERMRITSGGALLINRTSLIGSEKLSVNGKINATADSAGSPVNMLWMDTNGEIKKAAVPGGGSDGNGIYSGNGSLSGNTTITGAGNTLTMTGTQSSAAAFNVANTGNGEGISATTTGSGSALSTSNSGSGPGATFSSNSGFAVNTTTTTGTLFRGVATPSSTNTEVVTFRPVRQTSGTAAAGMGQIWSADLEDDAGNNLTAVQHKAIWTSAAAGAASADYQLWSYNSGTLAKKFTIKPSGQLNVLGYGSLTHTGTPVASLQVTSGDDVIVGPVLASGTYTPTLTAVSNTSSPLLDGARYTRIGNIVTFSLRFSVTTSAGSTSSSIRVTLPVSSSFSNTNNAAGTNSGLTGRVEADATNDELVIAWVSGAGGTETITVSGQYTIL